MAIYFLHLDDRELVKIEYSDSPDNRLLDLRSQYNISSYEAPQFFAVMPGTHNDEAYLHDVFYGFGKSSPDMPGKEWFQADGIVKQYMDAIPPMYKLEGFKVSTRYQRYKPGIKWFLEWFCSMMTYPDHCPAVLNMTDFYLKHMVYHGYLSNPHADYPRDVPIGVAEYQFEEPLWDILLTNLHLNYRLLTQKFGIDARIMIRSIPPNHAKPRIVSPHIAQIFIDELGYVPMNKNRHDYFLKVTAPDDDRSAP